MSKRRRRSHRINKKNKNNKINKKKSMGQVIKLALQLLTLFLLLSIIAGIIYFYQNYGKTLLQLQAEAKRVVMESTTASFRKSETSLVYDTNGELISTLKAEKDVYYIEYESIPASVMEALVVSEDRKFLEHDGVDYLANIRAAIALIKNKGEITQGASTITQQLARNVFLSHKVTYERKIEEIFIAQELEKKYSKSEIMEFYINNIYFSNGHYGILAAANSYFGKGVAQLSLSQIAFLCAIPNNPNLYNPITKMENTLERRDRILEQLLEEGMINQEDYRKALEEEIILQQPKTDKKNYVETYVYFSAIRALMEKEGFEFRNQFADEEERRDYKERYDELYYRIQQDLFVSGYRIYTSIDLHKQELLQKSVDQALSKFEDKSEEGIYKLQGAAVTIDNDNGRVVAIVGGRSQELKGYTLNRGYQSFRQPGSAIKPLIVYTPAFERGYNPDSTVVDERFEGGPKNSGKSYAGEMKLQRAVELSKNTVAWKLFEDLTPSVGLSYLLNMEFTKIGESDYVPAAALGGLTIGVSPLEMAAAYSTIENDGSYRRPTCIVKIMDSWGNEIVGDSVTSKQIYNTNAARIMTETLTGVIKDGTGKGLGLSTTISAGKTGTTDEKKDGWFVGYTPYYTTSVWVGYDMPKPLGDLTGSSYPGTIWHNFMEEIHTKAMADSFEQYDWRAAIRHAEEAAKEQEAKEQAAKEQAAKEQAAKEEAAQAENIQAEESLVGNPQVEELQEEEMQVEETQVEETQADADKQDTINEDSIDEDAVVVDKTEVDKAEVDTTEKDTTEKVTTEKDTTEEYEAREEVTED